MTLKYISVCDSAKCSVIPPPPSSRETVWLLFVRLPFIVLSLVYLSLSSFSSQIFGLVPGGKKKKAQWCPLGPGIFGLAAESKQPLLLEQVHVQMAWWGQPAFCLVMLERVIDNRAYPE